MNSTPPFADDGSPTDAEASPAATHSDSGDALAASVPGAHFSEPAPTAAVDTDVVDAEVVSGSIMRSGVVRAEVVSTGLDPTVPIPPDFPVAGAQPMPTNATYGWPEFTPAAAPAPTAAAAPAPDGPEPGAVPAAPAAGSPHPVVPQQTAPVSDQTVAFPAQPASATPATAVPYSGAPYSAAPYSGAPYQQYPAYGAQPGYPTQTYPAHPGYPTQPGYPVGGYAVPAQYAPPSYQSAPAGYPTAPPQIPGAYPPPYYMPEPPRRGRRGLLITGLIAGFVVLALCVGIASYSLPSLLDSSSATPSSAASPGASTGSNVLTDDQLFQQTLDAQGAALLKNDETGWLAAVDPAATSAVAAYKRLFHNLTQLHVELWKPSSSDFVELTTTKQTFGVGVSYCFGSAACTGTRATFKVTALKRDGKVVFEGIAPPKPSVLTNQPLPWEVATLTAVVGKRVIVAASSSWSFKLKSALATAEKAAAAADSYAQWGRPAMYVVYLASTTEGKTWFDGDLKHVDGVSYTISPTDIQVVIMMPYAAETGYAGPGGLNTVIQHEMGHVVTLWGATDRVNDHDSFIEGVAEYIAYNGHASWAKYRILDTRAYIRSGKWSNKCYLTNQITASSVLASSAAYGIGYLAMKYLADKYGQAKMLSFWGDVERSGQSLDTASKSEFGKSWATMNSGCATYVRHSVGA